MAAARPSVMARSRTGLGPALPPAVLVALGILLMMIAATAAGPGIRSDDTLAEGVCQSMDIRGNPDLLNRLKNCTVIEGQLSIVLMEKSSKSSFENLTFPKLREVTGHIQIYRLKGLTSLGNLFPNLAVVRGLSLFRDYAIVVYDNENLQSLGLRSLTKVERGAVRIENNANLCYANTIDWSKIVVAGAENVILRNNYDSRLCGLCKNAEGRQVGLQVSSKQCPSDSNGRLLCWDENHCQKTCQASCGDRACMSDGTCCDYSCLGGCNGPTSRNCSVCRQLSMGYEENKVCIDKCPKGTFQLLRRCVTQDECHKTPAPRDAPDAMTPDKQKRFYKTLNDTCIYNCPSGYMEMGESNNTVCVPCPVGGCVRECAGGKIDSLAAADRFRGCTHVKGNIEIEIKSTGSNTMAELEVNLGEVREIEGALKVIRAQPLVTLSFLKSLRKILGHTPNGTKKQPLYIFNNPNLELLWNWETHGPIEISEGVVFIHFNPKLCYHLIAPLKNMTRDPASTFGDLEVSLDSNGDQAICSQETMSINVTAILQAAAIISWSTYCLDDPRKLLGYSVYYTVAETNITQYERRDACNDNWSVLDVPWDDTNGTTSLKEEGKVGGGSKSATDLQFRENCSKLQPRFKPLTQLIPFTRYAVYVKTYTTMKGKSGAKSPIVYFKTLPGRPSQPLNVQVESVDAHSVYIRWSPPLLPNGTLAMYRIEIHKNEYNRQQVLHIDHCNNPTAIQTLMPSRKEDSPSSKYSMSANKGGAGSGIGESNGTDSGTGTVREEACTCNDQSPTTRFTSEMEAEHADSIAFENALQNHVYRKRVISRRQPNEHSRVRRAIDNSLVILSNSSDPILNFSYPNETDSEGYLETVYLSSPGRVTWVTVGSLRHYTWYTVSIWACRDRNDNETAAAYNQTWCSVRAFETFRTAEMPNADVVSRVRAEVITSNKTMPEVNVTWDPPVSPNGFVVAYRIHHAKIEDNSVHELEHLSCLSAGEYESNGGGFLLRNLVPGNYSVRVTPVTVGGPGNASQQIFLNIPTGASSGWQWAWGVVGAALAVGLAVGAGGWWARRTISTQDNKLIASVNPEYSSATYVPDDWEVPRTSIELLKELGQGSFGMVYEGIARNIVKGQAETRCAVKTVNEHATDRERIEFLNEASVMKAFDTWHVVRLLGVVSRGQPTLVVMELMQRGDLKSYLRSHRPEQDDAGTQPQIPPTLNQIYQMAIEIADGMAYLSAKKFVHRDLAARNCMVAGDLTVKIGDFGMTRDIYETDYYRKGSKGLLPVRWMSPESLKDGVFSSNSDAWSYGVVLWEMATLAMQPYQGLSNEQVLRYVVEGGVMERPEHCPDRLYDLMRACWAHRPNHRPSFLRLVADLAPIAAQHFRHRSFFHTTQGQELYAQQRINMVQVIGDGCLFSRSFVKKPDLATARLADNKEEVEAGSVSVGAVVTGSGSNLFGVSGRLASWVRDLSSLRSRGGETDAAAEPLAPRNPPVPLKTTSPPNGRIHPTTPC